MAEATSQPTAPFRDSGRGGVAVLIIDLVNGFDFEGGGKLHGAAENIVEPVLRLRAACDAADAPAVYVNDNFGEWHSEKTKLVDRARANAPDFVRRIEPREQDYFVIKPQLSGFYATNLPLLLPKLGVSRLILTGVAADMCVLFTAGDAHMRDYALWVPADAVAASSASRTEAALEIMRERLGAETRPSSELDLAGWVASLDEGEPGAP
ncbi:MAG TPA: isochorismatase family cysteine hydrolase [Croceibacterium sp.]|nr:isochorismatase family cysteine hydrolase [Croceibacterium sp.]